MTRRLFSMAMPLMQRVVCGRCKHMHRPILRSKCACCREDYERLHPPT